ncbi:MAG TPA: PIN domain-containing protein [Candidatus Lokiarchaeia archaeon]
MKEILADSNVFIASLIESDPFHAKGNELINKMNDKEYMFHISVIVPIEVSCSIARKVGGEEANEAIDIMENWAKESKIKVHILNRKRTKEAEKYGTLFKLKGMDAIIVQLAIELDLPLATFDSQIQDRATKIAFLK